jgi:phospholipid/cholesterol/gamma-HCH transport system ATP-binding protein
VLKNFANHVKQNIYITDTCFRYDLNKILVILPDTDANQALKFCGKLSKQLESSAIADAPESQAGHCYSFSAGIAQADKDSRLEALLDDAESHRNKLYECRN